MHIRCYTAYISSIKRDFTDYTETDAYNKAKEYLIATNQEYLIPEISVEETTDKFI